MTWMLTATATAFELGRPRAGDVQLAVAGAAVDSLIFPTLAFGSFMPHIVALQFAAKVAGGALWAALLARRLQSDQKSAA